MIRLEACERSEIDYLFEQYLASLARPLDGMWEKAFVEKSSHFVIYSRSQKAGFFCKDEHGFLLLFYMMPPFQKQGRKSLLFLISNGFIAGAYCSTGDAFLLSLLLDFHKSVESHTYLFEDGFSVKLSTKLNEPFYLERAQPSELKELVQFDVANIGADADWLLAYLTEHLERRAIYTLRLAGNGTLISMGECRKSASQPQFADLGMVVDKAFRRKHLGAYMINEMKKVALEHSLIPICSCEYQNLGSRKAVERAGFVSKHRIIKVRL